MKLIRIILFFTIIQNTYAQEESATIGIFAQNEYYTKSLDNFSSFGIRVSYCPSDRLYLYYNFSIGYRPNGKLYGHLPYGMMGGSALIINAKNSTFSLALPGLLSLFIPEGVGYNFLIKENKLFSGYLTILGGELYMYENYPQLLSGEIGGRFKYLYKDKLQIEPSIGGKLVYKWMDPAINVSVSLSYKF